MSKETKNLLLWVARGFIIVILIVGLLFEINYSNNYEIYNGQSYKIGRISASDINTSLIGYDIDILETVRDVSSEQNADTQAPKEAVRLETKVKTVSRGVPRKTNGKFKSYMDYRTITSKSSDQYKFQQECWTDEDGLRRYEHYYVVAMGTYYSSTVGDKFRIDLDNGNTIEVVIGDIKDDKHTESTNRFISHNGNIVEFIVDSRKLSSLVKKMGDVSYVNGIDLQGGIIGIHQLVKGE